MTGETRYYSVVRNISLLLLVVGLMLLASPLSRAQIHGVPASVTSLDNGNHTMFNPPGVPASVTSLGPRGFSPDFNHRGVNPRFPINTNRPIFTGRGRRDHDRGFVGGAVPYPVYVPYYYSGDVTEPVDDTMEQNFAPGPTIFDRRGTDRLSAGNDQYDERISRLEQQVEETEARSESRPQMAAAPAPDQPATVLVYRDGHRVEVKNYAIVGDSLYDYSTGTRRKIALADLDVATTQKVNDDRGVDFRVPGHSSGN